MNTFSRTLSILAAFIMLCLGSSSAQTQSPESLTQINGRCFANRYAGTDGGAKINAALADASCVVVDASELTGAQKASSTITLGKNQQLLLGPSQWTLNGSPNFELSGYGAKLLGVTYGQTRLINNTASGASIHVTNLFQEVGNLDLEQAVGLTRTGGAGIDLDETATHTWAGHLLAHDLLINVGYYGIWAHVIKNGGDRFSNVTFGIGGLNYNNIRAWIQGGPVPSCCSASFQFANILGNGGSTPPSEAGIVMDTGLDTWEFSNVDFGHTSKTNFTGLVMDNTLGIDLAPEWARFSNFSVEGSGSGAAIRITGAKSATFTNVSAAVESADHAIIIDGRYVNGVTFSTGFALYGNKEVIYIPGTSGSPSALNFNNMLIGDGSLGSPGTYCDMYVGPNVGGVKIIGNSFHNVGKPKISQQCSLQLAKGTGDHIRVIGNSFEQGGSQPFMNAAAGADVAVLGNSGGGPPLTSGAKWLNTGSAIYASKRAVAGCTTAASIGGVCSTPVTVTWPAAFADTNYSVTCAPSGKPTNLPGTPYVSAKAAGSVTVNYFATSAAAASWATIDCEAIHD